MKILEILAQVGSIVASVVTATVTIAQLGKRKKK